VSIDWNIVIAALIASLPATITAFAALVQAWKTHKSVNSRMDEMLKLTRDEAAATATVVEKEADRMRHEARAKDTKSV